ncbi:MAG TPA: sigma-70 family RNA polymerase sigma factor [Frankiaceae bacterium]|nr:sigma-70 family RNA polymerase sigma factor [Frankiaceae bacterium]
MPAGRRASEQVSAAVADAHRREWAFVLAATVRVARDIDLAEECVQEAYAQALTSWTWSGVPANPGAWLTTTARRRALDALRRRATLARKLPLLIEPGAGFADGAGSESGEPDPAAAFPDDRLRLICTCCHPSLAPAAQVALTLRLVCGLTTVEVARAFLVSEPTMAARLTRAKKKIAAARIPYRIPPPAELPARIGAMLTVVHLLFTTGHTAPTGGSLVRADLVERSLDVARMLHDLLPSDADVTGLLALLLLTDSRRATRMDAEGHLVLLADQDRARWNRAAIAEGCALAKQALSTPSARGPGRFPLEAAIAALHAEAPAWERTDWAQIVGLYDALYARWPSPVVALNRAVAVSFAAGPEAGLQELDKLGALEQLAGYAYLPAARADALRRLGRHAQAREAYTDALMLTDNAVERSYLEGRLSALGDSG